MKNEESKVLAGVPPAAPSGCLALAPVSGSAGEATPDLADSEPTARRVVAMTRPPNLRTPRPLDWVAAPQTFPEAVAYVAAYLERHPQTWRVQFQDGRVCHLSEALQLMQRWLRCTSSSPARPQAPIVRGEGWSL